MNELETFVYNVLNVGRLDATAVLALADWLIDHDDARGPLLRARCKRWKKAIDKATAEAEAIRVKFGETLAALRDACNAIPGMEYNLPSSIVTHHGTTCRQALSPITESATQTIPFTPT